MITFEHSFCSADANNEGAVDIDDNTVGISIEAAPNADDGFTYGIIDTPNMHMDVGDSREYGFLSGAAGFEMLKKGQIKIKWDNVGTNKRVLVIKTIQLCD